MIAAKKKLSVRARHSASRFAVRIPSMRPSILDPGLETEPRIDPCPCPCSQAMVLYLHNRPIAVIAGTPLEVAGLDSQLYRLRHRNPRRR